MNIQIVTRYFIRPELRELIHSKGLSIEGLRKPLKWPLSSLDGRFWGNATISKEQRNELGQLLAISPEDMDKFFTPWDKLERHLTKEEWKDLEDYPREWELEKLIHLKNRDGSYSWTARHAREIYFRQQHEQDGDLEEYEEEPSTLLRPNLDTYDNTYGDDDPADIDLGYVDAE